MKLIPKNNFLMLPNALIESYMKKLSPIGFNAMIVLLFLSQRFSNDKFHHTDQEIAKRFKISPASMNRARRKLKELGLIKYKSGFKVGKISRATRYKIFPSKAIRELFRIRDNQNDQLSKPP